jgi:hypothetical protein
MQGVVAGLGGLSFAGPFLHLAHGNPGRAGVSGLAHATLLLPTLFIFATYDKGGCYDECATRDMLPLLVIGPVLASLLDLAMASRTVKVTPSLVVTREGTWLFGAAAGF